MATPVPEPEEDVEHNLICRILRVSFLDSTGSDSGWVYLKEFADEMLNEGKVVKLSLDLMSRVVSHRFLNDFPGAEPPFEFLINVYRRAHDEGEEIATLTGSLDLISKLKSVVEKAKELAVMICKVYLGDPDMCSNRTRSESPLLPLILSEVDRFYNKPEEGASCPPDFFVDFFLDGDYELMVPVLKKLYMDLRARVFKVSALGNFQLPLLAMHWLVNFPFGARGLVNDPLWKPVSHVRSGRVLEMSSILGAFFRISVLPDDDQYKSAPDVGKLIFSEASTRDLSSSFTTIHAALGELYNVLEEIIERLLLNENTNEHVLKYLAEFININSWGAGSQGGPVLCSSTGMFVNLTVVLLRLCKPLFGGNLEELKTIDPIHVFHCNNGLELRDFTALHASSQEVTEWIDSTKRDDQNQFVASSSSSVSISTEKAYLRELFFMTSRVLKLGLLKAISHFKHLVQDISRRKKSLSSLKAKQDQTPSPQQQQDITYLENTIELYSQEELCYEAQLLRDGRLLHLALSYYQGMVVWLIELVGGFKIPLPSTCPIEFACLPEDFVADTMKFLKFFARVRITLDGVNLDDFMSFIIMFMANPNYIRNRHLRAKMVKVLKLWMRPSDSKATETLFEGHNLSLEYLVESLLKLYAEFTGSGTQFDDEFMIRHNIVELLEYLWKIPSHCNVLRKIAKDEETDFYMIFLNSLINDTYHLLDGSIKKIVEHKEREAEMSNSVDRVRQENSISLDMEFANKCVSLLASTSEHITAPLLLPDMVERVSNMLNYFLWQLFGPQKNILMLKHFEKDKFQPILLLKQIVTIYVNLAKGDKDNIFLAAIIRDGRSYNEKLFGAAADFWRSYEDDPLIQEFVDLGEKASIAASKAKAVEVARGDIPNEFLDKIMGSLMIDPVILPTTLDPTVRVERRIIERLLRDDPRCPFTRIPLTIDMLIPDLELKKRIEKFLESNKQKIPE